MNKHITIWDIAQMLVRLCVGGLFVAFGVAKAIEPFAQFVSAIEAYDIVPLAIVPIFAIVMIIVEILVGVAFIVGFETRRASIVLMMMLGIFIVALLTVLIRGTALDSCGCSGGLDILGDTPRQVLVRDIVMMVFVFSVYIQSRKSIVRWSFDSVRLSHDV